MACHGIYYYYLSRPFVFFCARGLLDTPYLGNTAANIGAFFSELYLKNSMGNKTTQERTEHVIKDLDSLSRKISVEINKNLRSKGPKASTVSRLNY